MYVFFHPLSLDRELGLIYTFFLLYLLNDQS